MLLDPLFLGFKWFKGVVKTTKPVKIGQFLEVDGGRPDLAKLYVTLPKHVSQTYRGIYIKNKNQKSKHVHQFCVSFSFCWGVIFDRWPLKTIKTLKTPRLAVMGHCFISSVGGLMGLAVGFLVVLLRAFFSLGLTKVPFGEFGF